uniref:Glutathione peroxidase n=1 Tax=Drosophila melanogaster TaxID=7227 RepID=Q4V4T9_DROME|nr:IP04421p [Drosophila melanogaster]
MASDDTRSHRSRYVWESSATRYIRRPCVAYRQHCLQMRTYFISYDGLRYLLEEYEDQGLRILNFPCNQFGGQMPESDGQEMLDHLRREGANIGHLFAKIDVKGAQADPLYKLLTRHQHDIEWNFVKFLVDRKGNIHKRYGAELEPVALTDDIELLLGR